MILKRFLSAVVAMGMLLSSGVVFAANQSPADSLSRLNEAVVSQSLNIDDATKNTVQNNCQNTQNNLKSLRQKEQRVQRDRLDTYTDIQNEINALQLRIKRQGVEVNSLAVTLIGYSELSDQYDRLSKSYLDAINDAINIDCRENPVAFVAGINLIRTKRGQLLTNTTQLRSYVLKDVQDKFELIKKDLRV